MQKINGWALGGVLLIVASLVGCRNRTGYPLESSTEGDYYLPPTSFITVSPAIIPIQATGTPAISDPQRLEASATPACLDNLLFLADLTIPDGSQVPPGATLDKQWQVENNGTCNWDARYRLRLIAGPGLGTASEYALFPARAGNQATIWIHFTAPFEAGAYRSAWQAHSPENQPFGDPIFIEITVDPILATSPP